MNDTFFINKTDKNNGAVFYCKGCEMFIALLHTSNKKMINKSYCTPKRIFQFKFVYTQKECLGFILQCGTTRKKTIVYY